MKIKTVVRSIVGDPDHVRVYVKGAPEYIFELSNETLDDHNQKTNFTDTQKDDILNNVISKEMAHEGLKVISYAFKDISLAKLEEMKHSYNLESKEFRTEIENDLTYLCTFGLHDPIREDIHETVNAIRSADGDPHG